MRELVPITYRAPFAFGEMPWRDMRPHGETILQIVQSVPNLPAGFINRGGIVCINGEPVPRELWAFVRPRPTSEYLPIAVTLHWPMHEGGKSGGSKSIIGLVAALALVVITAGIGALGIPGIVAGGTFGAQAIAGAVAIGGALAIGALTAPPTTQTPTQAADVNTDNKEAAGATGNILAIGGAIPRVVGTRKIFPPLICQPEVELINENGDERVSAIFALNGPHVISDMRVDGNSISGMADVTTEVKQGLISDTAPGLVTRQAKTTTPQITLSQHVLQSDQNSLVNTTAASLPKWHRITSNNSPDQITIHLAWPGGITLNGTNNLAIPIRIRCRIVGTATWINLPEIHTQANSTKQIKNQIVLIWGSSWPGMNLMVTNNGFVYAHRNVPGQSGAVTPATSGWVADSHFDAGSGNDYCFSGNEGSTRIKNMQLFSYSANFFMDPLPRGRYEIEIMRGCGYQPASFTKTTYIYSNGFSPSVFDFFQYFTISGALVASNQTNCVSTCILVRSISIWFQNPFTGAVGKFSAIQIQAVNRNIQNLSVVASGIVGIWNGTNWTSVTGATSNPAAHYRDVLLGALNHDPLDSTLVDDTGLQNWHGYCNTNGWTADAIIDDMRTQDVLTLLASCGYARPYQSDQYGVIIDRDRSADAPIQVFSRANTSTMKFEKAFARVPAGMIVSYKSAVEDFGDQQIVVNQSNPSVGTTGLFEAITYDGLIDDDRVGVRAQFDLDQANLRSTFYSFETDIESIVCRRGDLVAVQHDVLTLRAGDARIKTVLTGAGSPPSITGFVLNSQIPCVAGTGIAIRRTDGSITTHAINDTTDTDTITLTTPIANAGTIIGFDDTNKEYGCLIVSGDLATVYKRMLVFSIAANPDLRANVSLVDESPSLIRFPPSKTITLLHMDGANGGSSFPDATSRHTYTPFAGTITTTGSKKFGTASMSLPGGTNFGLITGDDTDWNFGQMDFTIECWLLLNTTSVQQYIFNQGFDGNNFLVFGLLATNQFAFRQVTNGGLTADLTTGTGAMVTGNFIHVAVERFGNIFTIFAGGGILAQVTTPFIFDKNRGNMSIGCAIDGTQSVNGLIDEFRISRFARYKGATFTPPAAAFTVD